MMLKFEPGQGNKQVFVQMDDLDNRTRRGIRQFFFRHGKSLLKSLNKSVLKKPRAGRVYKRKGRRHVASKAGESPANRSGAYRKSASYQIRGNREMEFGVRVKYGGFLENGTRRMEARPGLGNAVRETEGESLNDAGDLLENELTKP